MANLTEVSHYTRQIIKFIIIFIITFIVAKFSLNIGTKIWLAINPPPPAPPTVKFGKLPKIKFPKNEKLPTLSFQLETIEGNLPVYNNIGKVYLMPKKVITFSSLDDARKKARAMGFVGEPYKINQFLYEWNDNAPIPTSLLLNISEENFSYRYEYRDDPNLFAQKLIPTEDEITREAESFLKGPGFLPPDIQAGPKKIAFFRYFAPNLIKVSSRSEADLARIGLYREKIDDLPSMATNPEEGNISLLFSGSRNEKRIIEVNYNYFPVEKNTFATYPLKDTPQSWNELKNGQGYIANLGENSDGKIVIRKAYLAYYDAQSYQPYLQPIFVFEGDKSFVAYVSAISPEWVQE